MRRVGGVAALIADDGLPVPKLSATASGPGFRYHELGAGDIQLVDRGFADDIRSEHLKEW